MIKNMKISKRICGVFALAMMLVFMMGMTSFAKETKKVSADSKSYISCEADVDSVDVAAEETTSDDSVGKKATAAALVVGLAAAFGALGMGIAISKSVEGISRQPEAEGKIRTTLMLGLVFIETAIIYALIVAILIIFVM